MSGRFLEYETEDMISGVEYISVFSWGMCPKNESFIVVTLSKSGWSTGKRRGLGIKTRA